MHRFLTMIALLFAFAAVGGVATSNAMAYSSVPPALSQISVCLDIGHSGVVVQFKACGKRSSGIVMPCVPQTGVLTSTVSVMPPSPDAPAYRALNPAPLLAQADPVHLRPPIVA